MRFSPKLQSVLAQRVVQLALPLRREELHDLRAAANESVTVKISSSRFHFAVSKATISSRPVTNVSRLRQTESTVYAAATRSGSRVFQASSAAWTFCVAVSSVNGRQGWSVGHR